MYTYSGVLVDDSDGVPTLKDVAIFFGRVPRLCGAGRTWWSYLHYAYALAEIALLENKYYMLDKTEVVTQALIREAHSAITLLWEPGQPIKNTVQARIHTQWGVLLPGPDSPMRELIDRAATRTFLAEVECWAPDSMKKLPIFGDAKESDCNLVWGIWNRRPCPDESADASSEMVRAYSEFFIERNVQRLRHMIGYDKQKWYQNLEMTNEPDST